MTATPTEPPVPARPSDRLAARVPVVLRDDRALRWSSLANLAGEVLIVVTGGLVRLTGSGLGCPTWPDCAPGSLVPRATQPQGWHKLVEFGNRTLTFVLVLLAIGVLLAAWAHRPRRPGLPLLASSQIIGVLAQAVLGGITVRMGLNPYTVAAHLLLSMVVIAFAAVLVVRVREGDGPARWLVPAPVRALGVLIVAVAGAVLVAGTVVTGSGPHAGDPGTWRIPVAPATATQVHADLVFLLVGLTVAAWFAAAAGQAPARTRRAVMHLAGLLIANAVVGIVQYYTGLPVWLVALHMLLATGIWVGAWFLLLGMRTRPVLVPTRDGVALAAATA